MSTAKRGLQKIAEEEEEIPTSKQTKAERDKFKALKEEKENEDNNKVANTEEDGEKKVVEGEEEEEEEEEDEYANPEDFKKVEQAENMINSIMKDKALEYKVDNNFISYIFSAFCIYFNSFSLKLRQRIMMKLSSLQLKVK